MRIALLGAGSIGTIIGALISKTGEDLVLVDRLKEHVDALNKNGAKIVGHVDMTIPVKAITPDQMDGKYDLMICTTKQTTLRDSLRAASEYMHDDTIIMTLQNGIPEDIAKEFVDEKRVMGGGVEFGANWKAPGVTELISPISSLSITFAQVNGEITEKTKEIQKIVAAIGHADVTDNLMGLRYTKLTDNSTFSGMSAALGCCNADILDNTKAMTCIAYIGREAGQVIEKMGVKPKKLFGLQPLMENVDFTTQEELTDVIENYWTPIYTPFRDGVASMWQDIEKGQKCEINQINGKFVEMGKKFGVEVPFMEKVVEVVTKLQNRETPLEKAWDNLECFNIPDIE